MVILNHTFKVERNDVLKKGIPKMYGTALKVAFETVVKPVILPAAQAAVVTAATWAVTIGALYVVGKIKTREDNSSTKPAGVKPNNVRPTTGYHVTVGRETRYIGWDKEMAEKAYYAANGEATMRTYNPFKNSRVAKTMTEMEIEETSQELRLRAASLRVRDPIFQLHQSGEFAPVRTRSTNDAAIAISRGWRVEILEGFVPAASTPIRAV